MHISQRGLNLIKSFEGLRLRAYLCPANVWTIGYGSTGSHVRAGLVITEDEAEALLRKDLVRFEKCVLAACAPSVPLQEEFDAMVSLAFNIGVTAFAGSSVARLYKTGNKASAANAFGMWVKAKGKTLPGLVRRRAAEKNLFFSAHGSVVPQERAVSSTKTVTVPEESTVPDSHSEKPLTRSREIASGAALSLGSVVSFANTFSVTDLEQVKGSVQSVSDVHNPVSETLHIPEIASGLVLVIGIFMIYKRITDRNKGIR